MASEKYHLLFNVETRSADQGEDQDYVHIFGKAATFNETTVLFKDYEGNDIKETILPSAFANTDMKDVVFRYNHSNGFLPIARTRNKTVALDVKSDGLYFDAKINKSNAFGMSIYEDIQEGLIDRCSFAFTVRGDKGETFDSTTNTFTLRDIDRLYDVSGVDFPAYANTSLFARNAEDLDRFRATVDTAKAEEKRASILKILDGSIMKKEAIK